MPAQLKFDENGKELWVPVKKVDSGEQRDYMLQLYTRCVHSCNMGVGCVLQILDVLTWFPTLRSGWAFSLAPG